MRVPTFQTGPFMIFSHFANSNSGQIQYELQQYQGSRAILRLASNIGHRFMRCLFWDRAVGPYEPCSGTIFGILVFKVSKKSLPKKPGHPNKG